jgi:Sigma-70 region 2
VRFRAVYDANYHRVLGYALRRTTSRQDAEDVVADTFLTAWREGKCFRATDIGICRPAGLTEAYATYEYAVVEALGERPEALANG